MRLSRPELHARVNASLRLRYRCVGLTSFAGLELFRRYLRQIGLRERLQRHLDAEKLSSDYGSATMVMLLIGLLLVGGRRLRHLRHVERDPLFERFCGLRRLPTAVTVSRWLKKFSLSRCQQLQELNAELVAELIEKVGLRRLTIDVDGSVVSTGLKVGGAARGFNPHHRKVPSYYPITAHEAQSGQLLRVQNRRGNVHDGKASIGFLRDVFAQVERTLGAERILEFRMDGAFFRRDVLELLERRGAEYAIKVPFFFWIDLKGLIRARKRWNRLDSTMSFFEATVKLAPWKREQRIVIYRKKVAHESPKNYQLDLFDPADGHYEYSAAATNKTLNGRHLWDFMCGHGAQEKSFAELKTGFAFATIPTNHYGANSAWQILSQLAFNLTRGFQVSTTAPRRARTAKRRVLHAFETIQTLRYRWLNRAGRLCSPGGRQTLDVGTNTAVIEDFESLDAALDRAA